MKYNVKLQLNISIQLIEMFNSIQLQLNISSNSEFHNLTVNEFNSTTSKLKPTELHVFYLIAQHR